MFFHIAWLLLLLFAALSKGVKEYCGLALNGDGTKGRSTVPPYQAGAMCMVSVAFKIIIIVEMV